MDPCTITLQPAGPVGKRHVFLTLALEDDNTTLRTYSAKA